MRQIGTMAVVLAFTKHTPTLDRGTYLQDFPRDMVRARTTCCERLAVHVFAPVDQAIEGSYVVVAIFAVTKSTIRVGKKNSKIRRQASCVLHCQ